MIKAQHRESFKRVFQELNRLADEAELPADREKYNGMARQIKHASEYMDYMAIKLVQRNFTFEDGVEAIYDIEWQKVAKELELHDRKAAGRGGALDAVRINFKEAVRAVVNFFKKKA
jgi:hypothetical protein